MYHSRPVSLKRNERLAEVYEVKCRFITKQLSKVRPFYWVPDTKPKCSFSSKGLTQVQFDNNSL